MNNHLLPTGLVRPATRDSRTAPDVVFQGQGRVWVADPDSQFRQAMLPRMYAAPTLGNISIIS